MELRKYKINNGSADPFSIKEGLLGSLEEGAYRKNWTEDAFMNDSRGKETLGRTFDFRNIYFLGFFLAFFLFIIIGRIAWLQIIKGGYYYSLAEGNRIRVERVEARRGVIYDANHKPLVRNIANFLLYFVPSDLPANEAEQDGMIRKISEILGNISPEEIKDKLSKVKRKSLEAYQPLFISDNIEYEKAMKLYLESSNWNGVVLSNKTRREYDLQDSLSMSHILGYTGKINEQEIKKAGEGYLSIDYIGKMGIEYFWEKDLRGTNGEKQLEVDALGNEKKIIGQVAEDDGHNLVLAIDIRAQKKLEDIMRQSLSKLHLSKGVAVVMNPNNGEIIAAVGLPTYDINSFAQGISSKEYAELISQPDQPLFNRAISGEYPSGSTIKPVMAAAALQEGIINENTSFISNGGLRIGEWFFPDWRAGGHGITNVRKAIAESVNTFFYYIGGGYDNFKGLGLERIVKYEKLFNLGERLGVDLAGEASGFLPTAEWKKETIGEPWYIGDTYHLSIGQGDLTVTPLQVVNFTSFFANGGTLYRPHFVKEILNSQDELVRKIEPEIINEDFISENNVSIVRSGMRQTVTSGSARSLNALPVTVAGKTGTAQWSTKKNPHAWFIGFAPYEKAEIAFTILVEEGKEGSTVAVPIAKEFLEWYFADRKK